MKRSVQREQIFKILFRAEFYELSEMPQQEQLYFDSGDMVFTDRDKKYIAEKVDHILEKCPDIDTMLTQRMKGWTLDRVGRVELSILRLGVYEILWDEDVPDSVAISEAVELAKKFGGDENSGAFVNGVLASFVKNRPAGFELKKKEGQDRYPSQKEPSSSHTDVVQQELREE